MKLYQRTTQLRNIKLLVNSDICLSHRFSGLTNKSRSLKLFQTATKLGNVDAVFFMEKL
jgi:hypothetical protein